MKKQIFICSHTGYFSGGAETSLLLFLKNTKIDYEKILVTVPQNIEDSLIKKLQEIGLDYKFINKGTDKSSFKSYIRNPFLLLYRLFWRVLFAIRFMFLLICLNPEVVYLNTIYCGTEALVSKILGKKVIWHIRGLGGTYKFKLPIIKHCASLIITVANSQKEILLSAGVKKHITVVPNGIDLKNYSCINSKNDSNCTVIGTVSRIGYSKGTDLFCQTAQEICRSWQNVRFEYVGPVAKGEENFFAEIQQKYFSLIQNNNLNFLGYKSNVLEYLTNIDIFLFTSRKEGSPRVILEAMAMKKAIVSFCIDGVQEQLKDGVSGFLIEPYNINEMISNLGLLIENRTLRLEFGEMAYQALTNFSAEKYASSIDKILLKESIRR